MKKSSTNRYSSIFIEVINKFSRNAVMRAIYSSAGALVTRNKVGTSSYNPAELHFPASYNWSFRSHITVPETKFINAA